MDRARLSALARPLGWLLVAASAVFLVVVAREHWSAVSAVRLAAGDWAALAMLALAYGASLFLLAGAWHLLLASASDGTVERGLSLRAYGTSQLAKYVPGNVFHYVGRHMLHRQAGATDGALARAALAEIILMAGAALTVAAGFYLAAGAALDRSGSRLLSVLILPAAPLAALMAHRIARIHLSAVGRAIALQLVFFSAMAVIFASVVALLGERFSAAAAAIGVAGWIAGFVTPGASGGIGVREAALVFLGGQRIDTQTMLVAAALFRAVTFAGDLICFAIARALPAPLRAEPA